VLTKDSHWSLPQLSEASEQHPILFLWSILKLSSHLYLGLPIGLIPSAFPPKPTSYPSYAWCNPWTPHLHRFDHVLKYFRNYGKQRNVPIREETWLAPFLCKRFKSVHFICVEKFMPIMKDYKVLLIGVFSLIISIRVCQLYSWSTYIYIFFLHSNL
jgi:hypothetical protein